MKKVLILVLVIIFVGIAFGAGMFIGDGMANLDNSSKHSNVSQFTENKTEKKENTSKSNTAQSTENIKIAVEEAKEIALKAAGIEQADFIKVEQDFENGKTIYEIEFKNNSKKWEYDIDASTGKIISYDTDNIGTAIQTTGSTPITAEQAEEIALKEAGTDRKNVTYINSKNDYDDGKAIFEIKFLLNNREYEYEIDASTGAVISMDID